MLRYIGIFISLLLSTVMAYPADGLPVIEMRADRTVIYPERMELEGEETLMDILQMMPTLMIAGYEDVITNYNLRIGNCPINADTRLILSQMKAKDIARIQVCDNTGVSKGTARVVRGGGWSDPIKDCAPDVRTKKDPLYTAMTLGFRVVYSKGF